MGIQILNKDVSVISGVMGKAKASIGNIFGKTGWAGGGGTFAPGDFTFSSGTTPYTTNTVTFSKSGTLYISYYLIGDYIIGSQCYKNNQLLSAWLTPATAIANAGSTVGGDGIFLYSANFIVAPVNIGDTMYFSNLSVESGPFPDQAQVGIWINGFAPPNDLTGTGTLLTTFTITRP